MRLGMAMLATIGATSPFVGLFGTVWGIMNSFIGISKAQTTNLAVVAPGIAEALLATAIGLVAAIPAVIIYNHFSRATKAYLEYVGRGSGAVGAPVVARSRPVARDRLLGAGGGVGRWRLFSAISMTTATNSARRMTSTSRPSSTSCWCCSSSSWSPRRCRPSICRSTCRPPRRCRRKSPTSRPTSRSNPISRSPSAKRRSSASIWCARSTRWRAKARTAASSCAPTAACRMAS